MFDYFKKRRADWDQAERLYFKIVEQSRLPYFYRDGQVEDTVDGRFDMVVLHAFPVFNHLKQQGKPGQEFAQTLFNVLFKHMDYALREMGVGDLSVGKKIKKMAEAFYGRVTNYETALAADDKTLREALHRNLYRSQPVGPDTLEMMATYLRLQVKAVSTHSLADLREGRLEFGALEQVLAPV